MMNIIKNKGFLFWLFFVAIFFVFTIIITYPLLSNFSKGVLGPPPLQDHRIYLWEIDHFGKNIFSEFKNPLIAEDIFYPRGLHFQDMNFTLSAIIVSPIGYFFKNPTIAYNFWIFLGYMLAGIFTFLLAFQLTKNKYASFMVSVVFAFSPYHYQVVFDGELELSGIFWIPLLLYCLVKFLEKRTIFYAILLSFVFSLTALSSGYYGAFSILLIPIFTFIYFAFNKDELDKWKKESFRKTSKIIFLSLAIALIILLPFYFSLYKSDRIVTESGYQVFKDSFTYKIDGNSADISNYIFPLPFYFKNFSLHRSNIANCFYITLLLLPAILFYLFKKNKRPIEKTIFCSFVTFFILSMGSSLRYDHILLQPLGLKYIPLPGSILHLIPVVGDARAIIRLGIFANIFASLLIGFMLLPIFSEKFSKKIKLLFLSILTLFFFIETYSFIIPSPIKPSIAPMVYKTITKTKEDFSIIEYPLRIACNYPFNEEELFYQTIHGKKTVFGFAPFRSKSLEEHLGKFGAFSQDKEGFRIDQTYLKEAKVRYILVNRQKINDMFPDKKEEIYNRITNEIKSIPSISFKNNIDGIELYEIN